MSKKKVTRIHISEEAILARIHIVRGQQVILDAELAALYGVETKVLNQAVTRNMDRFPEDFMFRLTKEEWESLRSQIVTSNGRGGRRYAPRVFTEPGVAMLSGVLNSPTAIQANIQIIRAFINLRHILVNYQELWKKMEAIESKYDKQFGQVFNLLKQLLIQEENLQRKIGFKLPEID